MCRRDRHDGVTEDGSPSAGITSCFLRLSRTCGLSMNHRVPCLISNELQIRGSWPQFMRFVPKGFHEPLASSTGCAAMRPNVRVRTPPNRNESRDTHETRTNATDRGHHFPHRFYHFATGYSELLGTWWSRRADSTRCRWACPFGDERSSPRRAGICARPVRRPRASHSAGFPGDEPHASAGTTISSPPRLKSILQCSIQSPSPACSAPPSSSSTFTTCTPRWRTTSRMIDSTADNRQEPSDQDTSSHSQSVDRRDWSY